MNEPEMHWTEKAKLEKTVRRFPQPPRDRGDNDPADPEQNWGRDE